LDFAGFRSLGLWVMGADVAYLYIPGGPLAAGRVFTRGELAGAPVWVV
jgi:hypothetical protein